LDRIDAARTLLAETFNDIAIDD
jgi:hypothetical protein